MTQDTIKITEYVVLNGFYVLREALCDEHPESIESKFRELDESNK